MLQTLEFEFQSLQHKFQTLKHKFLRRVKTFSPRSKKNYPYGWKQIDKLESFFSRINTKLDIIHFFDATTFFLRENLHIL